MSKTHCIIIACVFFLFVGVWYLFSTTPSEFISDESTILETTSESLEETETKFEEEDIMVYITGCVKNPGVYKVPADCRIVDVLVEAGGETENADLGNINLAKHVYDEMHIVVPERKENGASLSVQNTDKDSEKININTASEEELKALRGIGDGIAKSIVEYRENNGFFKSIEDIKKVSRIGDKMFEQIKNDISV